jgi:hypothetical protein
MISWFGKQLGVHLQGYRMIVVYAIVAIVYFLAVRMESLVSLPLTFNRLPVRLLKATRPLRSRVASLTLRRSPSISQGVFNAAQVFPQPSKNEFAVFAARHLGAKELEDEWIGGLSNSPDRCLGSLSFEATQTSAVDEDLWVLADGSTTKLSNPVARRA